MSIMELVIRVRMTVKVVWIQREMRLEVIVTIFELHQLSLTSFEEKYTNTEEDRTELHRLDKNKKIKKGSKTTAWQNNTNQRIEIFCEKVMCCMTFLKCKTDAELLEIKEAEDQLNLQGVRHWLKV